MMVIEEYPKTKLVGLSNRLRVRWRRWSNVLLPFTAATTMPTPYGREAIPTLKHDSGTQGHNLDPNLCLPTALSTLMQPQPLIARQHLFVTGTLRYFAVRYTDLEGFDAGPANII